MTKLYLAKKKRKEANDYNFWENKIKRQEKEKILGWLYETSVILNQILLFLKDLWSSKVIRNNLFRVLDKKFIDFW